MAHRLAEGGRAIGGTADSTLGGGRQAAIKFQSHDQG